MRQGRAWLIILLTAALVVGPLFLKQYDLHVFTMGLIYIMLAAGVNLTLGFVGQPDFGHAAFFGLGAYTAALLATKAGLGFISCLVLAILVCAAAGFLLGLVSLRMRAAYFCIATIMFAQVLGMLSTNLISLTGGPMGLGNIPEPVIDLAVVRFSLGSQTGFWLLGVAIIAAMLLIVNRLYSSKIGRAWVGMREDEALAKSVGVDTFHYALAAYVIAAGFGGATGSFYAYFVSFLSPDIFSFGWSSSAVVAAVLGGKGTLLGPLIGGFLVNSVPEYLRLASDWRLPIFGAFLIVVVIFLPNGLISLYRLHRGRRLPAKEGEEHAAC